MNGRIYDPLIGRFMSADPYIQAPDDLQSHNRYAYVMNNPLNLDDPSGYWSISKAWKRVWRNPIFKAAVGILVAIYAPQFLNYIAPSLFGAGSLATTVATGALSGFASTGTLKGALTGALTAGLMFGAGEIGQALKLESGGLGKIALHAGAGCISSVAGGGSCKAGAISGALGEAGLNIDTGGSQVLGTIKGAMLGGIGSKLAGGKFADGAQTGAFGYLFNELLHSGKPADAMKRAGYTDGGCSRPCDPPLEGSYPVEEFLVGGAAAGKLAVAGISAAFNGGSNSVFWSGFGLNAMTDATAFGTTLEMTIGGKVLTTIDKLTNRMVPDAVWNFASKTFANNATGTAQALIRTEGKTWSMIEKPILQQRGIPIKYQQ